MVVLTSVTMVLLPKVLSYSIPVADAPPHYSGHAGAMLQARRLGKHLLVGIHSDADILENKGPTVMTLEERLVPAASTDPDLRN